MGGAQGGARAACSAPQAAVAGAVQTEGSGTTKRPPQGLLITVCHICHTQHSSVYADVHAYAVTSSSSWRHMWQCHAYCMVVPRCHVRPQAVTCCRGHSHATTMRPPQPQPKPKPQLLNPAAPAGKMLLPTPCRAPFQPHTCSLPLSSSSTSTNSSRTSKRAGGRVVLPGATLSLGLEQQLRCAFSS